MPAPTLRHGSTALTGLLLTGAALAAAPTQPPAPGRYAARMCVASITNEAQPADCGPVDLWLQRGRRAELRISDIAYRLQLHSSQVDVVLMHGAMQIDGFTAPYEWAGQTLRFTDREKGLRYEVDVGAPAR